jgi:protein phosphatase
MAIQFTLFGATDVGLLRDHNEDNFAICKDLSLNEWSYKRDEILSLSERGALLIVADGMGGTNAGEVASHLAQESVKEFFSGLTVFPTDKIAKEELLCEAILEAHEKIVSHQKRSLETAGMGTTIVIGWIIDGYIHVAWSGDSRCYLFQGQEILEPFTDDHSLVWKAVMDGQITSEQARLHPDSNIISQSLGDPKNPPAPSVKSARIYKDNIIILCSDGLSGMISNHDLLDYLKQDQTSADLCRNLIAAANQGGGTDNITCLVLHVVDGPVSESVISIEIGKTLTTKHSNRKYKSISLALLAVIVLISVFLFFILNPKITPENNNNDTIPAITKPINDPVEKNVPLIQDQGKSSKVNQKSRADTNRVYKEKESSGVIDTLNHNTKNSSIEPLPDSLKNDSSKDSLTPVLQNKDTLTVIDSTGVN